MYPFHHNSYIRFTSRCSSLFWLSLLPQSSLLLTQHQQLRHHHYLWFFHHWRAAVTNTFVMELGTNPSLLLLSFVMLIHKFPYQCWYCCLCRFSFNATALTPEPPSTSFYHYHYSTNPFDYVFFSFPKILLPLHQSPHQHRILLLCKKIKSPPQIFPLLGFLVPPHQPPIHLHRIHLLTSIDVTIVILNPLPYSCLIPPPPLPYILISISKTTTTQSFITIIMKFSM